MKKKENTGVLYYKSDNEQVLMFPLFKEDFKSRNIETRPQDTKLLIYRI